MLEHIDMPSVISTHFSVGYMVPVDLLCALCDDYPLVIGINCSIGQDFTYLVRLLDEMDPRVEVHVGGPMHALSALAMGGTGFLSSEANLVPQLANRVVAALRRRRLRRLRPMRTRRCCGCSRCCRRGWRRRRC